jgi:hypothetical protein
LRRRGQLRERHDRHEVRPIPVRERRLHDDVRARLRLRARRLLQWDDLHQEDEQWHGLHQG